jgi:hypothetical protein
VVTVGADGPGVEQRLASGGLSCPVCSAVLAGWGHARARQVRGPQGPVRLRPRRSRCTGCGVTHVLLPVLVLVRRADTAAVIWAALAAHAAGAGQRRVAVLLDRPVETVRGWLRRFAGRLEAVRAVFTGWCRALAPDPVLPGPAGSAWADTLAVMTAAAAAALARFGDAARVGPLVVEMTRWETAVAVSAGRLLAPGWPGSSIGSGSTRTDPAAW